MANPQKNKGDNYERELAAHISSLLSLSVIRAPLSGGGRQFKLSGSDFGVGSADLTGTPYLHVEAKRVERLPFRDALAQAEYSVAARKSPDVPVVITRRNRETIGNSICILRLHNFLPMYDAWLKSKA